MAGKYTKQFKRRGASIASNTTKVMRAVILAVDQAVVLATPVATGRARSNWRVNIGPQPDTTVLGEPQSREQGTHTAIQLGQQVAASYGMQNSGDYVNISNSLDYVEYLNQGSSKQAPINYVKTAATTAIEVVRRSKLVTGR